MKRSLGDGLESCPTKCMGSTWKLVVWPRRKVAGEVQQADRGNGVATDGSAPCG
jgi:hypothetical protein